MPKLLITAFLGLLIIGCSTRSENKTKYFTIDSVFRYKTPGELRLALGDSTDHPSDANAESYYRFAAGTTLDLEAEWPDKQKPIETITLRAESKGQTRSKITNPDKWVTQDGVYAWIPIDSLQAINGKPFYLDYDGKYFHLLNWEEGKLAKSGVDVHMILEGNGQADPTMSSQEIIDRKMKVRTYMIRMSSRNWAHENQEASQGLPGDYTVASTRILTDDDIEKLSNKELRLMRNEVFARHGHIFKSEELSQYFGSRKWYHPKAETSEMPLTDVEKKNIALIAEREDYLYPRRPIVALIKNLPLISLPVDLEAHDSGETIPHDIEDPNGDVLAARPETDFQQWLFGILPDTSRFYGVVWYGIGGSNELNGYIGSMYITTFDKKFRPIGTTKLWVPHSTRYDGDCSERDEKYESVLNEDLTFYSSYSSLAECAGDGAPRKVAETISGKINTDGSITKK